MADGAPDEQTLSAYSKTQQRFEHHGGYRWRDSALVTLRGLGFGEDDLDRPLTTFSGGELTRGSLARALTGEPDLLLLDEPTNHLDIASLEWLEKHLAGLDAAIVLVAHDRWFLEAVGTSVLELEAGPLALLRRAPGTPGARRRPRGRSPWAARSSASRPRSPAWSASWSASGPRPARRGRPRTRVKRLEQDGARRARPARRHARCRSPSRSPSARAAWCSSSRAARIEVPGRILLENAVAGGGARRARDARGRQRHRQDHADRDAGRRPRARQPASCAPATT